MLEVPYYKFQEYSDFVKTDFMPARSGCSSEHTLDTQRKLALIGATIANSVCFSCIVLVGGTARLLQNAMNCDEASCTTTTNSSTTTISSEASTDEALISNLQVGWLAAAPLLTGSLLRLPGAILGDQKGQKAMMLTFLGFSLTGAFLLITYTWLCFPWAGRQPGKRMTPDSYPILYVAALLIGCGATVYSVGIAQVSYWYPLKLQGRALGIYGGIGSIAPSLCNLILAGLLAEFSAPPAYLGLALLLAMGTAAFAILGRDSLFFQNRRLGMKYRAAAEGAMKQGQELLPDRSFKASLKDALHSPSLYAFGVLFLCSFGGFSALSAWIPVYLAGYFPEDTTTAAGNSQSIPLGITAAFVLIAGLVRIATGIASDRVKPMILLFVGLLVQLAGQILLVAGSQFAVAISGLVVTALGFGMSMATALRLIPVRIPRCNAALGIVTTCGSVGGFFFPPMIAVFTDIWGAVGYRYGFIIVLGVTGLGLLAFAYLFATRHQVGEQEKIPGEYPNGWQKVPLGQALSLASLSYRF